MTGFAGKLARLEPDDPGNESLPRERFIMLSMSSTTLKTSKKPILSSVDVAFRFFNRFRQQSSAELIATGDGHVYILDRISSFSASLHHNWSQLYILDESDLW
jgi:hypothetical protein